MADQLEGENGPEVPFYKALAAFHLKDYATWEENISQVLSELEVQPQKYFNGPWLKNCIRKPSMHRKSFFF